MNTKSSEVGRRREVGGREEGRREKLWGKEKAKKPKKLWAGEDVFLVHPKTALTASSSIGALVAATFFKPYTHLIAIK
jgi:hypothetical protein